MRHRVKWPLTFHHNAIWGPTLSSFTDLRCRRTRVFTYNCSQKWERLHYIFINTLFSFIFPFEIKHDQKHSKVYHWFEQTHLTVFTVPPLLDPLPCWKMDSVTEVTSSNRALMGGKWSVSLAKICTIWNSRTLHQTLILFICTQEFRLLEGKPLSSPPETGLL